MNATALENVQTILLDLDDTLWENNAYFLLSIGELCRIGRRFGLTDRATEHLLNTLENRHIPFMGFGYTSYEASYMMALRMILHRAGAGSLHAGYRKRARAMMELLRTHPIDWLPGVEDTLPRLRERFHLVAVTKGQPEDQWGKLHRSGKAGLFHAVEVVPRKSTGCYRRVLGRHRLDLETTVMVGNSPHSDINQPKRAGLRTVYIPHPQTWHREMEPILPDGPPTIEIGRFDQLLEILHKPAIIV